MKEIKRGHYQLSKSILECWKNQGCKYIKGKLSELFKQDEEGIYINIKSYWNLPHQDDLNLFVLEINSEKVLQLLEAKEKVKYIVSHQQL